MLVAWPCAPGRRRRRRRSQCTTYFACSGGTFPRDDSSDNVANAFPGQTSYFTIGYCTEAAGPTVSTCSANPAAMAGRRSWCGAAATRNDARGLRRQLQQHNDRPPGGSSCHACDFHERELRHGGPGLGVHRGRRVRCHGQPHDGLRHLPPRTGLVRALERDGSCLVVDPRAAQRSETVRSPPG